MYKRIGSYDGREPLEALAARKASFDVSWADSGFGTTQEHVTLIRDAYHGDLGSVLPGTWAYTMLVLIRPGGYVHMHDEAPKEPGLLRHHLVLATNDRCWNFHDGDWQQLELGGIYTVDETKPHASINFGDTVRVHLVVDVVKATIPALLEVR